MSKNCQDILGCKVHVFHQVDGDGAPAVQGSRMVARKSTTTNKKPETQPVNRWESGIAVCKVIKHTG